MLEAVGNPVAVNPDRRLGTAAKVRGWRVEHWDKNGVADGVAKKI